MGNIIHFRGRSGVGAEGSGKTTCCIDQLLGKYDELKLRHLKPGILLLKSRVALAAGNNEEAHQTLYNVLALSDEMGTHHDVWGTCWALRELETERANEACATQYKERVLCNEVMLIAKHTETPELREIFLSRPDVRVTLNGNRLSAQPTIQLRYTLRVHIWNTGMNFNLKHKRWE